MFNYVDLIGLGGTGSNLIEPLVRFLIYSKKSPQNIILTLIDGDVIESKNLERAFNPQGVNKYKVEFQQENLINIFKNELKEKKLFIKVVKQYIKESEYKLMLDARPSSSRSLCIAAVDNDDTRSQLIKAINNSNRWVMFTSPGNEEVDGQVISWLKGKNENPLDIYDQLKDPDPSLNPGSCAYKAISSPQLFAINHLAASKTLSQITLMVEAGYYHNYTGFSLSDSPKPKGTLIQIDEIPIEI